MADSLKTHAQYLAKNLVSLRKKRGMSQGQLSQLTGLPRSTLTYLESGLGNPSLQNLIKLAEGLQLPLEELLSKSTISAQHFRAESIPKHARSQGSVLLWKLLPQSIRGIDMDRMGLKAGARLVGIPHLPYTREFLVCLSGSVEVHLENEKHSVQTGDVLAFPGDQRHSYHNSGRSLTTLLSVVAFSSSKT